MRRLGDAKARQLWQAGKSLLIIVHPQGKCSLPCISCARMLFRTGFGGKIICRDSDKQSVQITVTDAMEVAKPSSGQRRRAAQRDNTTH